MMVDLTVLIMGILLLLLIFAGVPIGYSLFIVSFIGIGISLGFDQAQSLLWSTVNSGSQDYSMATIPMFILMAMFLERSGMLSDVYESMNKWTQGTIPGGLAIGTIFSNGIFAALSGSSTAASAAVAKIAHPELEKYGYDDVLSMGTIAASGTFAMMFPPSLGLIIYGVLTDTSIGAMFIAGIIPGLLTLVAYVALILVRVSYDPSLAGEDVVPDTYSWTERFQSTWVVWPAGVLMVLVLGSLYTGIVTPTESGALGAFGALVISLLIYGISREKINSALIETATITAYVFILILGARYFGRYIALEGVVNDLLLFLTSLPVGTIGILLIILAAYILFGMFFNQLSVLVLTLPITYPLIVDGLGFSPIWFGIIVVKTIEIGLITPPIGINVYVVSKAADVDPSVTFRGVTLFIVVDVLIMIALIALPEIATFLPNQM